MATCILTAFIAGCVLTLGCLWLFPRIWAWVLVWRWEVGVGVGVGVEVGVGVGVGVVCVATFCCLFAAVSVCLLWSRYFNLHNSDQVCVCACMHHISHTHTHARTGSWFMTFAKALYYNTFALVYGAAGGCAHITLVNGSWTQVSVRKDVLVWCVCCVCALVCVCCVLCVCACVCCVCAYVCTSLY